MTGRSVALDPRSHAVRRDLADIRLADQVFAPHYATPLLRIASRSVPVHAVAACDGERLGELAAGEHFEMLELSSRSAWGIAVASGLVGYVDADALEPAA